MCDKLIMGPPDNCIIPLDSLGKILYNKLKTVDLNKTALIMGETKEECTYGQLLKYVTRVSVKLKNVGIQKNDIITILTKNNWKCLVSIISGLCIGVQINLLNPDYTEDELKHFFSFFTPNLIFASKEACDNISKLQEEGRCCSKVICFDDDYIPEKFYNFNEFIKDDVTYDSFKPTELDCHKTTAFILTSSGTTALPKCLELTHSNFRTQLLFFGNPDFMDMTKNESTIGIVPFFHVWGLAIALGSLVQEIKLVIMSQYKPDIFLKNIEAYKTTKLFVVPAIVVFLAKSAMIYNYDLSSVKELFCGTSVLKENIEKLIMNRLNLKMIYQLYGLSELSGAVTMTTKNACKIGTVGKLLPTCQLKICHVETEEVLGPNETGEVRLKSSGLMKGYLGKKTATAETLDKEGFVKTGDLGFYDNENFLFIVDRIKDIIKYKSFQVCPAELEYFLMQHPSVKDAGVVGLPDEKAGELPIAFVVKYLDKNVTEEELVTYVSGRVSLQKHLRGGVKFIDEIPRTHSGKICRNKLRALLQ